MKRLAQYPIMTAQQMIKSAPPLGDTDTTKKSEV